MTSVSGPTEDPRPGDGPMWLDADQQRVWRTFVELPIRLNARLDAELQAAHRLSLTDYEVLVHLSEAPERALRMSELARRLQLSPSGLTRRLDGLVGDGLVDRRACPTDRRGALAELTEAGMQRLREAAPTHVAGARRYVIDALGEAALTQLGALLGHIHDALDDAMGECPRTGPDAMGECPRTGPDAVGGCP